jgi:hypothetical protein
MLRGIGLPELAVLLVVGLLLFVPAIFYVRTLKRALERCSLESRTMSPGKVWLLLVPLFGEIWQFFIVINVARSLHNEFTRRNLPTTPAPGRTVGLAMCILTLVNVVPLIGPAASAVTLVCWCVYWVKIANYSRMLETVPR